MSMLNNRITYLLTYIYMRDTTLLLIYYGPVLNAPAIFEVIIWIGFGCCCYTVLWMS